MQTNERFSFFRWLCAGFAFGLGLMLSVVVCTIVLAMTAGAFAAKKGMEMIGSAVSEAISKDGSMVEAEGVYLVSTNITKSGSTVIVTGTLTNSTAETVNGLLVWASLMGDFELKSEGLTWTTEHLDSLAPSATRELTFVYENIKEDTDVSKTYVDLEVSRPDE